MSRIELIALALFGIVAMTSCSHLPIIKEASVQDLFEEQRKNICEQSMPCMWEVYERGPSSYFIPTERHNFLGYSRSHFSKGQTVNSLTFAFNNVKTCEKGRCLEEASVQDLFEEQRKNICEQSMPCMWEVYERGPSSYFIPTDCHCPEDLRCMVNSEELSVSAYVYTCQQPNPMSRRYPLASFRAKRRYFY
ncbi:unnamed protein product [Notodromas monacha]|uniref:Uncharacterized protein n=1 Tax=Notodromas monacha TaxID=399045 RepID=A0A7R9BS94_9CRUS|nr:unnamed protein product [Notodromas monacha]CAG0919369.1 unnamed protein product [Notodromas monacha]